MSPLLPMVCPMSPTWRTCTHSSHRLSSSSSLLKLSPFIFGVKSWQADTLISVKAGEERGRYLYRFFSSLRPDTPPFTLHIRSLACVQRAGVDLCWYIRWLIPCGNGSDIIRPPRNHNFRRWQPSTGVPAGSWGWCTCPFYSNSILPLPLWWHVQR